MVKKYGQWNAGSICRDLLWECCDLYARTPEFEATYKHYYNNRVNKTFKDPEFRVQATEVVKEFYDYFAAHIDIWPMFGTLLGMVRTGELIPHDNDVDFGFFKKDEEKVIQLLEDMHGQNGFKVIRNQFQTIFSIHKNEVLIDLYEYELLDGSDIARQGSRPAYDLARTEIFPFKEVEFVGKKIKCINNPISFFERYYGHDWQTPK